MMKTFGRIGWICMMVVTATLMFVSCGNSQKNKVQSGKTSTRTGRSRRGGVGSCRGGR